MKKLAFLTLLALAFAISSCGNTTPTNVTNTQAAGNWEAQLTRLTGDATGLSFVTAFSVTNVGPLDITGFGFLNSGECFATGKDNETVSGSASFTTASTGQVTGQLTYTVNSITPAGNVLTLTSPAGGLTGTSNGTTTTTGTLSNGVVQGTWTLTPGPNTPNCTGTGNFLMCQGAATCTVP
jgi:hypothetical protein